MSDLEDALAQAEAWRRTAPSGSYIVTLADEVHRLSTIHARARAYVSRWLLGLGDPHGDRLVCILDDKPDRRPSVSAVGGA